MVFNKKSPDSHLCSYVGHVSVSDAYKVSFFIFIFRWLEYDVSMCVFSLLLWDAFSFLDLWSNVFLSLFQ